MGQKKKNDGSEDLTEQQDLFCMYVLLMSRVKAYMKAYPDSSYNAASVSAYHLLRRPNIKKRLDYLKKDLENITGVSKARNLAELAKVAYSNMEDYHNTWISLNKFETLTSDQKAAIARTETKTSLDLNGDPTTYVKIELHPKLNALNQINDMMGYKAAEQKEVYQRSLNENIDLSNYTYEQLKELTRTDTESGEA